MLCEETRGAKEETDEDSNEMIDATSSRDGDAFIVGLSTSL